MKIRIVHLLVTVFCFIVIGCVPDVHPGGPFIIENNSEENIYYWFSRDFETHHYPNISLPVTMPNNIFGVASHNSQLASNKDPNWESIFNHLPEGQLTVYFFAISPQSQQEWDSIVDSNYILSQKSVTFEELKDNNYRVAYP